MLDERKIKVLYAVINSHLASAEPIGSRTISKEYDLGVSAATIRNEMSDLEDRGYLTKPHSSAGRIPSDKAYRLYVDELLKVNNKEDKNLENKKVQEFLYKDSQKLNDIIRNSAKILSSLTSYTAVAMTPRINRLKLKHIQLMNVSNDEILMVVLNSSGGVNNAILRLGKNLKDEELFILSNYLNERFTNCSIDEIINTINEEKLLDRNMLGSILKYILPFIKKSLEDISEVDIYLDGVTKILNFPEYQDFDKAKTFIDFIENEETLVDLFKNLDFNKELSVLIGNENPYEAIKDCSIITTNYKLGSKTMGKLGIIGPIRMDYVNIFNTIDSLSKNVSEVLTMLYK